MRINVFALLRWLLGSGCLVFSWRQMSAALKIEGFGAAGYLIFGFAALIAAVLLIAPETVGRICEFFAGIFINVTIPGAHFSKPPLSYRLARRYGRELRESEAIAEYRKIIHYYPKEKEAYLELIAITHRVGAHGASKKYARLFRRRFKEAVIFLPQDSADPNERA